MSISPAFIIGSMVDVLTKEQRSYNMSQVKSKNTLPERIMYEKLKERKLKFKRHYGLQGKPDILFNREKVAIFIDGEFWHGRNFEKWKGSLTKFWLNKIGGNVKRDKKNRRVLKKEGWKVVRLWDKDIIKNPEKEVGKILKYLNQSKVLQ